MGFRGSRVQIPPSRLWQVLDSSGVSAPPSQLCDWAFRAWVPYGYPSLTYSPTLVVRHSVPSPPLTTQSSEVLHFVELALRNALYTMGDETTAGRNLSYRRVRCWLDAAPPLLERNEDRDVESAITSLGRDPRRHTPGHLVAQLTLGFWVRLFYTPYEQGNVKDPDSGHTLRGRLMRARERKQKNRSVLSRALGEVRDIRNLISHHQPVWDRNPARLHARTVEVLGWLNPSLSATVVAHSALQTVHDTRVRMPAGRTR